MIVNITMLVRDRKTLTQQAIESLQATTKDFTLTVLDDASQPETRDYLLGLGDAVNLIRNDESKGTGEARNQVLRESVSKFGCGDYLYLSDNDVLFRPLWLETLIEAYERTHWFAFRIIGAYNHPYNPPFRSTPFYSHYKKKTIAVGECHAVAMQSWLLTWETIERFGRFSTTPVNRVRMSEDHQFCQRVREAGYKVGVVVPALIANTSRTDSFGELIPGHELVRDKEGVIIL